MNCPKCTKEKLAQVIVKVTGQAAFLCETCDILWFEGEAISKHTGHPFASMSEMEYIVDPGKYYDSEHRSLKNSI